MIFLVVIGGHGVLIRLSDILALKLIKDFVYEWSKQLLFFRAARNSTDPVIDAIYLARHVHTSRFDALYDRIYVQAR
jgi:hypothetical protein